MVNITKKILPIMTSLLFAIQSLYGQNLSALDTILRDDSTRTIRLMGVNILPSHTYFDEKGRSDINFSYTVEVDIKGKYAFRARTDVRFLPTDTNEIYKIEELHFPQRRLGMNASRDVGYPTPPKWSFTGYSNDTTLLPVRIYRLYQQNAPVYKVYEPDQLDEEPYFNINDSKVNCKEYVSGLLKNDAITNNMCGTVTFSFEINANGRVLDFKVEEMRLKPKNEFIRINGDWDINFAQQINILFCGLNYKVVEYGFYMNDPNRYWTFGKINGEAVASKQYITLTFE